MSLTTITLRAAVNRSEYKNIEHAQKSPYPELLQSTHYHRIGVLFPGIALDMKDLVVSDKDHFYATVQKELENWIDSLTDDEMYRLVTIDQDFNTSRIIHMSHEDKYAITNLFSIMRVICDREGYILGASDPEHLVETVRAFIRYNMKDDARYTFLNVNTFNYDDISDERVLMRIHSKPEDYTELAKLNPNHPIYYSNYGYNPGPKMVKVNRLFKHNMENIYFVVRTERNGGYTVEVFFRDEEDAMEKLAEFFK